MADVFFKKADSGYRGVRGGIIQQIQTTLFKAGFDPQGTDGVYGNNTDKAVRAFQQDKKLSVNGSVDSATWAKLMPSPPPAIFERCLQVTADFEGQGFQKVVGNFDGAGLTWGIIGFTLQHGEIQAILNEAHTKQGALFTRAFGAQEQDLLKILQSPLQQQLDWGNSISLGRDKYRVEDSWADAFKKLGEFPEVQAMQMGRVGKYWNIAQKNAETFKLKTELGLALCFDIAVQNGGIDSNEQNLIQGWIKKNPGTPERNLRLTIADVVAENSRRQYIEDVRSRKRTLASGEGTVHGAKYALHDWSLTDVVA